MNCKKITCNFLVDGTCQSRPTKAAMQRKHQSGHDLCQEAIKKIEPRCFWSANSLKGDRADWCNIKSCRCSELILGCKDYEPNH